jgi:hypothetical protein
MVSGIWKPIAIKKNDTIYVTIKNETYLVNDTILNWREINFSENKKKIGEILCNKAALALEVGIYSVVWYEYSIEFHGSLITYRANFRNIHRTKKI